VPVPAPLVAGSVAPEVAAVAAAAGEVARKAATVDATPGKVACEAGAGDVVPKAGVCEVVVTIEATDVGRGGCWARHCAIKIARELDPDANVESRCCSLLPGEHLTVRSQYWCYCSRGVTEIVQRNSTTRTIRNY
jgi:hypothetical protein